MGMDFVALLKYGGPDDPVLRNVESLAAGSPPELKVLSTLFRERKYSWGQGTGSVWTSGHEHICDGRPALPNLTVALRTPDDFFLTFGKDTIRVYHLLRWLFFLTDPILQKAMLTACRCLSRMFGASDCIITSDFSPVNGAFLDGHTFCDSLKAGDSEDGEREVLADLYLEIPEDYVMREDTRPRKKKGRGMEYMDWDKDKPPPEGWERASTWDSKGFWRLRLNPPLISESWLTWNGNTVQRLAEVITQERAFDLLPILADALEDAGCTNQDILSHCRGPGPHVLGCWVVDLLLGKE